MYSWTKPIFDKITCNFVVRFEPIILYGLNLTAAPLVHAPFFFATLVHTYAI